VNGTAVADINGFRGQHQPTSRLRQRLSQRSFHSQRQQSGHSSIRAKLSLGRSWHQFSACSTTTILLSATDGTNQNTNLHLSNLLTQAGKKPGSPTRRTSTSRQNGRQPAHQRRSSPVLTGSCPSTVFSGIFAPDTTNQVSTGRTSTTTPPSTIPQVFFSPTLTVATVRPPSNPLSSHYAPLQQLFTDLANNTVADYNWITPDQFNDMHTTLSAGLQRPDRRSRENPARRRLSSAGCFRRSWHLRAYKNHGVIVIWFDEVRIRWRHGRPGGRLQPYYSGNHHFRPRPQKTSAASPTPAQ